MKIGIFGGAFDPVHCGHTALAGGFSADISPDLLLLVPTADPPHRASPALASMEDRVEMLSYAFSDFKNVQISDLEFKRQGKSYTYDTVCALQQQFPAAGNTFYLLVGSDEFLHFHEWYNYKELLNMATLYTMCRVGVAEGELFRYGESVLKTGRFFISKKGCVPISSSEIREKIHERQGFSQFLNPKVYNYIETKGLYGV